MRLENKIVYEILKSCEIYAMLNCVQYAIEAMKRKCLALWELWMRKEFRRGR